MHGRGSILCKAVARLSGRLLLQHSFTLLTRTDAPSDAMKESRITDITGFVHDFQQVLVECIIDSDNQYVLKGTPFENLKDMAEHLNRADRMFNALPSDRQKLSTVPILFIHGFDWEIRSFLQSIGIADRLVSSYCELAVVPCEEHVRAFEDGESFYFKVKYFATSSSSSGGATEFKWSPHLSDPILMALEHSRRDEIRSSEPFSWNRKRSRNRMVAFMQATSVLFSPCFVIVWSQALTMMGYSVSWLNPRSIWQEIVRSVKIQDNVESTTVYKLIVKSLHCLIMSHESETLRHLHLALDDIDEDMASGELVRYKIHLWRNDMGFWKIYLRSREEFVEQYKQVIENEKQITNALLLQGADAQEVVKKLDALNAKLKRTLDRCEVTFSSFIGSMNLIESKKAIAEAEQITKLTQLAFVFVPLTFVTGVFGMNLKASVTQP